MVLSSAVPDASTDAGQLVSVILPTYNRAVFLPDAFASVVAQDYLNWELIVVDDGSTDDTTEVLSRLVAGVPQPVTVVHQDNTGSAGARNTGLERASGEYVAFLDSDDLWLPYHVSRCVHALARSPELDWVFGACRIDEMGSGQTLEPDTFRPGGAARPFLGLQTRRDGELFIIEDPRVVEYQIRHGLYSGLQNSVIRRRLFERHRFWTGLNVGEDESLLIRALAEGMRIGYFDAVHAVYRVHADNLSGAAVGKDAQRSMRVFGQLVQGLERIQAQVPMSRAARRALARRIAHERFWGLGYAGLWQGGDAAAARACYWKALRGWPWSARMWKTFAFSLVRSTPKLPATVTR
jgi:cellulose synthase/poly-beta-1,6-N-acetylglucosamine synthase-like glycosyltransferase